MMLYWDLGLLGQRSQVNFYQNEIGSFSGSCFCTETSIKAFNFGPYWLICFLSSLWSLKHGVVNQMLQVHLLVCVSQMKKHILFFISLNLFKIIAKLFKNEIIVLYGFSFDLFSLYRNIKDMIMQSCSYYLKTCLLNNWIKICF